MVAILNRELTLPLMLDSTSDVVLGEALKCVTGKPVINSINFEDGGAKLHKVLKLLKHFPAAVVALTIDETGMAQTKEDKLSIAERLYNTWTQEYGYPESDLIIDFLTFSVASGDEASRYAAVHTLEAIREFKARHPLVNTTLGVSNVSFGLSAQSRTVLNAVFLDKAVQAGLDTAIVHAEKVIPISSIAETELQLCSALLDGAEGALDAFIAHFANAKELDTVQAADLPADEALKKAVITGDSSRLDSLIDELLKTNKAADILNDVLLKAMQDVGVLFNSGKLLLPFVLKSAEVMRQCTTILEPHLNGGSATNKGVVVLATVKGDVHDIGKNLVDIILTGNGYKVINMGTKVSGEEIAKAAIEHKAAAIGMSGLLVKSVEIMRENIELFSKQGLDVKVLLGGAALSEDYVTEECAPLMPERVFYCKDAFAGVLAMDGGQGPHKQSISKPKLSKNVFEGRKWAVQPYEGSVVADMYGSSDVISASLKDILPFLHKKALFETRWGVRKTGDSAQDKANLELAESELASMLAQLAPIWGAKLIYGFYPVWVRTNELWIKDSPTSQADWRLFTSFPTGLQQECFTDLYVATGEAVLPLQVVTLGARAGEYIRRQYEDDKYSLYYKYHSLLAELTDALAAYAQQLATVRLRPGLSTLRYSFGYPLCPDLAGNVALCNLLDAERIGISLTETMQMDPEYSTCAMLSWHPESKY
jgi:5-methyltetrahydrofolate--homocysteine methyltransferase